MTHTTVSNFYCYEDYNVLKVSPWCVFSETPWFLPTYINNQDNKEVRFIIDNTLPVKVMRDPYNNSGTFVPNLYEDHPELLKTAKTVYIHKQCHIPRSILIEKYKKSLNPWYADAVVLPELDSRDYRIDQVAIFINEEAKLLFLVPSLESYAHGHFKLGKTFGELCKSKPRFDPDTRDYTEKQIASSKLMYVGDILTIHNTSSCIIDILTRSLPTSKVVLEQTVQKSLASENNKIDLDTLVGIYEMLKSEDAEVIGTGLKALSMLDYIHFTNSVHYILSLVGYLKYKYNKATHFTSVKYMLKILNPTGRSKCWHYDKSIYAKDLELLKQLIKQLDPVYKDNVSGWFYGADFMYYDTCNNLVPRIKNDLD